MNITHTDALEPGDIARAMNVLRWRRQPAACAQCGETFPAGAKQRFCSTRCRKRAERARRAAVHVAQTQ